MNVKLAHVWTSLLSTYWFIPSLLAVGGVVLAFAVLAIDKGADPETVNALRFVYSGGPEGSRTVLNAIATTTMNTAGVAFTVTIAALSLASGQFGPRLLDNFMRDRGNQVVLGTFLGTYLYCLLVLRTARGDDEVDRFVPQIGTTVGVLLAGASIAAFIFFIHHIAMSIQAPHVVALVAGDLRGRISRAFPADRTPSEIRRLASASVPEGFDEDSALVAADQDGYLQALDEQGLIAEAVRCDAVIGVERRAGHFVVRGQTLARVWPADRLSEEVRERLRNRFILGERRTHEQDVEFAMNQLVELAVRALSPSTNDPFTAISCVERLGAALCEVVRRESPARYLFDERGALRLVLCAQLHFPGLVDAAFNQIRQNAPGQPSVMIAMLETLRSVTECTDGDVEQVRVLRQHAELVYRAAMDNTPQAYDRETVEQRYRAVLAAADDTDVNRPPSPA
jgi:uncharacterized membrane protein